MQQREFACGSGISEWVCVCVFASIFTLTGFCPRCRAQELVDAPHPKIEKRSEKKTFWLLSTAVYGASFADMHQWISLRNRGNEEVDPLAKPFARWPTPGYYAGGLALTTGVNLLSYKMGKSPRWHKYRRIPQLVSIGGNTFGYFWSRYTSNR